MAVSSQGKRERKSGNMKEEDRQFVRFSYDEGMSITN